MSWKKVWEIGDSWSRKNFEHIVVAKVKHDTREGIYVHLVSIREFGTDEYEYYIQVF